MNVAVVVSGGLTETILATPLCRTLRAGDSGGGLVLLCPQAAAVIADGLPDLDEVIPLAALDRPARASGAARIWFELRRRRLDAVMLCADEIGVCTAAYLSGTPRRIASARGVSRLLLTASVDAPPGENLARTWLRLAAALGVREQRHRPAFEPGPQSRERADWLLSGSPHNDGRLLIAIAPGGSSDGAGSEATAWPAERYAHLANQLAVRHGAAIAIVGQAADRAVIEQTKLDLGAASVDVAGATDPRTIAAVLARCDLLIAGDTPLLHLAAAVGTPTVGLFGPTDGLRQGPYGADHRVIQALPRTALEGRRQTVSPASMDQIRVEDVLASIESSV